jgi:hypothetical protein
MHNNAIYAIKSRAQRLKFPKYSNISAASSMEQVLDVRYVYTSAVDRVMRLAFRLIEARLDSPPHRSLGIGSGFGPISASMSRITCLILGPPAGWQQLALSCACLPVARAERQGQVVVGPPTQSRPRPGNHHQDLDHRCPVLDPWVRRLNPSQREGKLQPKCALDIQFCKHARYAKIMCSSFKYDAYFAYICRIWCICNICTICTLAYLAYSLHIVHIFYTSTPETRRNLSGSRRIFCIFYILKADMHLFRARCIYMEGRCISAIFGISSWNHGGLPERDLDVDRRIAVERFALLPAVNSEFCLCKA